MIYLFTNLSYGEIFIERLSRLRKNNKFSYRIILRDISIPSKKSFFYNLKNRIKKVLVKLKIFCKYQVWVESVQDVNSEAFQSSIAKNSYGVCAGFSLIFKEETLNQFESMVNFHPSILPYYRGPVPLYWCLENKEQQTGITLHQMTGEIDRGDIFYQESLKINEGDCVASLAHRVWNLGLPVFDQYITSIFNQQPMELKTIDPSTMYLHKVGYRSFPKSEGS